MRAFLRLGDGLRHRTARGNRRLALATPPDYPQAYMEMVLAENYRPSLREFTADYLAANPTRKRALDLLPLLSYLNEDQVRSALPREKIGRRPVFHYRLPQAHVGERGWGVLTDWQGWLTVERLALADQEVRHPDNLPV